jgi:Uncharacterized alpha/beta hydrolase domain (DUF2235)
VCEQKGGDWLFAGIPINFQFLGIFDTVASVGLANMKDDGTFAGHQSWADNSLQIHPAVRQCHHYVAGHEIRGSFPLDSVRIKGVYPPNAKEVMYPGAHSDVGGGYAPNTLGIAPEPLTDMSVIVGSDMYKAAYIAGVPLQHWKDIDPQFQKDLTPAASTIAAYNAYLRDAKIAPAPVEQVHRAHMRLYHAYRYYKKWRFTDMPFYKAASKAERVYLDTTQTNFLNSMQELTLGFKPDNAPRSKAELMQLIQLKKSMNKAAGLPQTPPKLHEERALEVAQEMDDALLTPAIEAFLGKYVHDSLAGFMAQKVNEYDYLYVLGNRMGLAKFRSVFKGND